MNRNFDIGHPVIFVDEHGLPKPALLTAIHGEEYEHDGVMHYPCVNLVYCSTDAEKTDPYGRQIERSTSVPHKRQQSAHGLYWMWPNEEPNPIAPTRK